MLLFDEFMSSLLPANNVLALRIDLIGGFLTLRDEFSSYFMFLFELCIGTVFADAWIIL
jgi:hypothetical protein